MTSAGEIIEQDYTFYKVSEGRLKMRKFEAGHAELIFYLRRDTEGPILSSYEKATITPESVDGLHSVLDKALWSSGVVKKIRHLFMVGQTRVHIDGVEYLADLMELEVVLRPQQSVEGGQKIANNLMEELGIKQEDLLAEAYTDLLNEKENKQ